MRAAEFYRLVTMDRTELLDRLLAFLERERVRYCVIGGLAVNAYVEPLVTLDVDFAIAAEQFEDVLVRLRDEFELEEFPHSININETGSSLRAQIQKDPRYSTFVSRASRREVLGHAMFVASVEDVLQGKIWAALDPARRPSKRRKDLLDIERLIEAYPDLRSRVPRELLDRLL